MKIKFKLDDYSRPIWEAALRAKEEVASWPAWKRGDPQGKNEASDDH